MNIVKKKKSGSRSSWACMPALAVIYYRRNGRWLNSRTQLPPGDLLTLALFFFHSASFSPGRYAWLSLFWPLVHLIDGWLDLHQPAIAWLLTIHGVGPARGDNCAGREGAFQIPQRHPESQRAGRSWGTKYSHVHDQGDMLLLFNSDDSAWGF